MTVVHPNHIVGINSITVATGDALSIHKNDGTLIRTIVNEASGVSTFHAVEVSKGGGDLSVGVSTFFIDNSTGKIGIGTDNVLTPLFVSVTGKTDMTYGGGNADTACVRIQDTGTTNDSYHGLELRSVQKGDIRLYAHDISENRSDFCIFNDNNGTFKESLRVKYDGKVGFGLTDPGAIVHAYHATSNTIGQFESGDAGAGVIWKDNSTYSSIEQNGTDFIISADQGASHASSALSFKVDTSEKLRITNEGYVQVKFAGSATSGGAPLYVGVTGKSSITYGGGGNDTACLRIEDEGGNDSYYHGLELRTKNSGDVRIYAHDGGADNTADLVFATDKAGASPTEIQEKLRIDKDGHTTPGSDNAQNLGSSTKRWANIYSADLQLSNEGKTNDVDGTWGNYTIQEGESELFLINNRNGKKYKFNLTEVN